MKHTVCIFVILILLCVPCYAETVYSEMYDSLKLDELYDAVPDDSKDIKPEENISFSENMRGILNKAKETVKKVFGTGLGCVISIIAISIICSSVESLALGESAQTVKNVSALVAALAVIGVSSGTLVSVIGMGKKFIMDINSFSKALLPSVVATESFTGASASALAKASATILFSDILISLISYVLLPLVYINIFAAAANAASPNIALNKISDLVVNSTSVLLKFLLGIYVSYITVVGIATGGVDKLGIKTAQFALGSAVPVVGGIISETAETMIAGAALIKNTVGVFGLLVILSAFISPFVTLSVNYLMFKLAATVSAPMIGGSISGLTDRIAQSFGIVLGMTASVAVIFFISIIAAMQGVGVA